MAWTTDRRQIGEINAAASGQTDRQTHDYLIGLRGLLVIETFLWCFLQTFVPTTVKDAPNRDGPLYQTVIRDIFSVVFWNYSLIYSFIVVLSARTIALPFLCNPSRELVASSVFRRGIRLWIPTAIALGLAVLILNQIGHGYIDDFKSQIGNNSFATPDRVPNFLVYFNSVFDLFWGTYDYSKQMGNTAFPSQTLWIVNLIFQQSYTVYMTQIIIPYTRKSWHVKAFFVMIAAAWWVQSWAWYSFTGLLLADVIVNMDFRTKLRQGLPLYWKNSRRIHIPTWLISAVLILAGVIMEYIWVAWRPQAESGELKAHSGLYNSGDLNHGDDYSAPQPRDDNYLIMIGVFLILESSTRVQWFFKNPLFMYLGSRSFSYLVMQSIIIYTAGIKLFLHLSSQNASFSGSVVACLVTTLAATAVGAELFYRLVDYPSQALARRTWAYFKE
ncbi:hypothetical protein K490DRAFT_71121 [Saccharata proteae CBS 121410]|uniref:Acyltransferase 3 domain-containing protein n=1 Tax=Saccharata proteae CBS 121410 TaxID=1314787 RepID=A0A9P4LXP3_9PEZI|nr:hypothetical protein K490DRAFT_71121 [Saccharata proteae CBS 121410]